MEFKDIINGKEIIIIYQIDNGGRKIYDIAETIEDAYDLCVNFLNDEFHLKKEEVLKMFEFGSSDYLDIFNPKKISSSKVFFDKSVDFKNGEYFFRIWKTNTHKIK
jgi:hypothetical protein